MEKMGNRTCYLAIGKACWNKVYEEGKMDCLDYLVCQMKKANIRDGRLSHENNSESDF